VDSLSGGDWLAFFVICWIVIVTLVIFFLNRP
jgi:hypothetical protein